MNKIGNFIKNSKYTGIFIVALATLIYANTIPNKWTLDDGIVIHKNQLVQKGISGIPDIFSHDFMYGSFGENTNAVSGGRWRPLSPAMYAIFSELLAQPAVDPLTGKVRKDKMGNVLNDLSERTSFPNVMHFLNVVLYALLCLTLYQFLLLIFKHKRQGYLLAFIASVIFTVHPLHTEVVANIKGSDEILSLLFSLLSTIIMYKAHCGNTPQKTLKTVMGALCLFFGMLSKENAAMFTVIIPLTIWFFGGKDAKKFVPATLVLLLPLTIYLGLRTNAVGTIDLKSDNTTEMMNNPFLVMDNNASYQPLLEGSDVMVLQNPSLESVKQMPAVNKLATNIYTFGRYLKLLIIPYPLTCDYYPRHIAVQTFSDPKVIFSLIVNIALLTTAVWGFQRRKIYAYGILLYFITFSIVSNIIFPVGTNMAERFMFMPSVGVCIIFSYLLCSLAEKTGKNLVFALLVFILACYAAITIRRNLDWKDNFTLISHDLKISVNSAKIKSDFGEVVLERITYENLKALQTQTELTEEKNAENISLLKESLVHYKEALDIYPMYGLVWFNLARTNRMLGDQETLNVKERLQYLKTAEAAYNITNTYKPKQYMKDLHTFKSLCYSSLGKLYGQSFGDVDQAIKYLHLAESTDAKNSFADFLLGTAYSLKGEPEKSFYYTEKAYKKEPTNRDYQENYALAIQKSISSGRLPDGNLVKAENLFRKVIQSAKAMPDESKDKSVILKRNLGFLYENYRAQGKEHEAAKIISQLKK